MEFSGIVQKGARRGSGLGYPTINIPLTDAAASGIYAATVKVGEESYEAAAFADPRRNVLEAHLLDFSGDVYGWNVRVQLLKKIRDNKRFAHDKALVRAIAKDVDDVRAYFKREGYNGRS